MSVGAGFGRPKKFSDCSPLCNLVERKTLHEPHQAQKLRPQARRDFIDAVTNRAAYYGLTENQIEPITEQGGGALIPDGPLNPGGLHIIATGSGGHLGLYRLETQVTSGNGSLRTSGLGSSSAAREAMKVGFDYYKANAARVSASVKSADQDYHLHIVELHNTGPTTVMTLAAFVALCSGVLGKPLQSQ